MSTPAFESTSQGASLRSYRKTDVGHVRQHNEDSSFADPKGRYFIVADGMGGHAAGEVASKLAVEAVSARLDEALGNGPLSNQKMRALMKELGEMANRAVIDKASEDPNCHGMGTTLEVVAVQGSRAWIGHVGDSRTYLIRGGAAIQQTSDHTVAARLSQEQRTEMSEMLDQWGSVLVEAIGAKEVVNVDVEEVSLKEGDRLLLCSDGLYEYFDQRCDEMAEVLSFEGSEAGLDRLVQLALDRGGKDNITGLLVHVEELGEELAGDFGDELTPVELPKTRTGDAQGQGYGIEDAIELMRLMPDDHVELVMEVIYKSLRSAGKDVGAIIEDAQHKQTHVKGQIKARWDELEHLKGELEERKKQVAAIEADLAETQTVRERLELAQNSGKEPDKKPGPSSKKKAGKKAEKAEKAEKAAKK